MDNGLAAYMGRNLKDSIANVEVCQGTAKDSGNIYYYVQITFINGYPKRLYLQSAEAFAFTNAFEMIQTNSELDSNF